MAEKKKTPSQRPESFEDLLQRLEHIVESLESGELSLDEALARYEEGAAALKACREKLAAAEKRIELLTRDEKGTLKMELFAAAGDAGDDADRKETGDDDQA